MSNLKISYLITCCNEERTLEALLKTITQNKLVNDEVVILQDRAFQTFDKTNEIINQFNIQPHRHALLRDYGSHKNFGIQQCHGDFIFQCDGDEMPPESLLGENLHALINNNPSVEAYAVPRINAWEGLTPEHAKQWHWPLDISPTYNRLRAAWPDPQWRIFRRDYPRIKFHRRLHEKIEGYNSYSMLPSEEIWALYHDKTIQTQIETNLRYNEWFTFTENLGHDLYGNSTIFCLQWSNEYGPLPEINTIINDSRLWKEQFPCIKARNPFIKENEKCKVIGIDKYNGGKTEYDDPRFGKQKIHEDCTYFIRLESII